MRRAILRALVLAAAGLMAGAARGEEINAGLPHDSLAFAELNPGAGAKSGKAGEGNSFLDVGIEAMESFGVLPKEAALVGDIAGLASVAGNHRSCVALLDADLGATPEKKLACKSVQLAWVIDTGGGEKEARAMVERLTHLLDHLATPQTAKQEIRETSEGKRKYVEFRDTRWPEWMSLAWVQDGDFFVVTYGAGAMEHYLAGRPVGGAPWVESLGLVDAEAAKVVAGKAVLARVYVSAKTFRDRFPDAMNKTMLGTMFGNLGFGGGAGEVDVGVLSARGEGKVISLDSATISEGKIAVTPWTATLPADSPLLKLVPAEATAYLALRVDWVLAYSRTLAIFDAMLTDVAQDPLEKKIADFAAKSGVDVRKDILARLQPIVVVHDAPQHPLRLPLMVTAVAAAGEAEHEKAAKVLTTLLTAAGAALDKKAAEKKANDFMRLRIRTDKDGVMYLQFGLVGPAWVWDGSRLVFSWSPTAVRDILPLARNVPVDAFTIKKER